MPKTTKVSKTQSIPIETELKQPLQRQTLDSTSPNKIEKSNHTNWKELIPTKILKALCRHTIAAGFAIVCFALTGWLASWLFPEDTIKFIIHLIDYIGISLILIFLLFKLFEEIIKSKGENVEE